MVTWRVLSLSTHLVSTLEKDMEMKFLSFRKSWATLLAAVALTLFNGSAEAQSSFVRGDSNLDETVDISDGVATLGYLFLGGPALSCLDAADVDDSGEVLLNDAVYLFANLFSGGRAIPAPYPGCGMDTTSDRLDCERSTCDDDPGGGEPPVEGDRTLGSQPITWTDNVTITYLDDMMVIESDGIPQHETGPWPGNPNSIGEQNYEVEIPLDPELAETNTDTQLGIMAIGINGVVMFNPYEGGGGVVPQNWLDDCNAHPSPGNMYHYHKMPTCWMDDTPGEHSWIYGFSLDGFAIYGPNGENGRPPADLDECNGHFGPTPREPEGEYHYHMTTEFPFILGCYSGRVTLRGGGGPGGGGRPPPPPPPPGGGGRPPRPRG